MKVFSIQQPWAWLIVTGLKDVENRNWRHSNPGLRFRGRVLIHAGKRIDRTAAEAIRHNRHPVTGARRVFEAPEYQLGGIVGEAEIVDCVTQSDSEWFVGPYGFLIRNARPMEFLPYKGQLGFFELRQTL